MTVGLWWRWVCRTSVWLIWLTSVATPIWAADVYPFESVQQQQQFVQLTTSLRCLVCQNETLAASQAPLAVDLRREIYHRVQQGDSSIAIKHYLVQRYGDFILYRPPLNPETYMLWIGPLVMLLLAVLVFMVIIRRHRA